MASDWFNSQVYQYSGAKEGELDGTMWSSIVHPDGIDQAATLWTAALKTGSQYETQFRIRRAEGVYRWHLVRSEPILDANSKVLRWIGTNTDIEDQKRVADQLAESDARLRLAIEAGQLAVWELDVPNLRITPSPALNRLCGFAEGAEPTLVEYQSRYAPGELERIGKLNSDAIAYGQAEPSPGHRQAPVLDALCRCPLGRYLSPEERPGRRAGGYEGSSSRLASRHLRASCEPSAWPSP